VSGEPGRRFAFFFWVVDGRDEEGAGGEVATAVGEMGGGAEWGIVLLCSAATIGTPRRTPGQSHKHRCSRCGWRGDHWGILMELSSLVSEREGRVDE